MASELTTDPFRRETLQFTKNSLIKNSSSTLRDSQIELKIKQLLGFFRKEIHNKRENTLLLLWKPDEKAGAALQHGKETV